MPGWTERVIEAEQRLNRARASSQRTLEREPQEAGSCAACRRRAKS